MPKRLQYLLQQQLTSSISEAELLELRDLLETMDPELQVLAFKDSLDHYIPDEKVDPAVLLRIAERALEADKRTVPFEMERRPRIAFYKNRWLKYAAAVLILVGAVGYWLSRSGNVVKNVDQPVTVVVNDIPAGSNRAVLTLSDGTQITLDSAANGTLAEQGATRIVKEGQRIIYKSGKKASEASLVFNTIATPRGGQYALILPDGSKVWLNAASSITYPAAFGRGPREVRLTGEAYLEITKDKSHPFRVQMETSVVEVLGTRFNVNAYANEDKQPTTLLEGAVRISTPNQVVLLEPGQQGVVDRHRGSVQKVLTVNTDAVVAWSRGLFNFDNADFQSVMRQLERWYDIDVRYVGPVPARHIQGKMERRLSLGQVLAILGKMGIHTKLEGRILTIHNL